jgi:hypothetical protein
VIVRWPVLDTGRNSVTPSTTPRRIASKIDNRPGSLALET